jgi:hypothetical protein
MGTAGRRQQVDLRQPSAMLLDHGTELRVSSQVGPLLRVILMVVELLAAVGVADVPPSLATDAMAALVVAGDGGALARGGGVSQLRDEADALPAACSPMASWL